MTDQDAREAAKVIRRRCCRAADGCDILENESIEIATEVLRAVEALHMRNAAEQQERLDDFHN